MRKSLFSIMLVTIILINACLCGKRVARNMVEDDTKKKVCERADPNSTISTIPDSLTQYIKDLVGDKAVNSFIVGLVGENGDMSGLVDFLLGLLAYLIMIALGIITLIVWPITWCLCCCKCCCFNKNKKSGLCGYINYGAAIALFVGIIVASAIGLTQSTSFVQSFNGSSCYLLNFFDHILLGDEKNELPRWAGLTTIDSTLTSTSSAITDVQDTSHRIFDDPLNTFANEKTAYTTSVNDITVITTIPVSPEENSNIISLPYQQLNKANGELVLGIIHKDQAIVTNALEALDNIHAASSALDPGPIQNQLSGVQSNLGTISTLVSDLSSQIGTMFVNLQDSITDYLVLGFQVLFGVLLGLSSCSIVVISLYVWLKIYWLRIIVHVLWNLTMLLTILSFLIGGVLGLLGEIGTEVVPVFGFLLSNPDSPLASSGATDLLGTCLNGNGQLAEALNITGDNDPTGLLNTLYDSSVAIRTVSQTLATIGTSASQMAKDKIVGWKNDLNTIYENNLFENKLEEAQTACSTTYKLFPNTCPVPQLNCENVAPPYTSDIPPISFSPSCSSLLTKIQQSLDENYKLLIQKSGEISLVDDKYVALMLTINDKVDNSYQMTEDLISALNPVIGPESSFYDMLNCGFIKDDIIIFLDQFGNIFANSSKTVGISLMASSFCGFIGVFFFIASMNYFTAAARGEDKKKENDIDDNSVKRDMASSDKDKESFRHLDNNDSNKEIEPSIVKYSKVNIKEE